MQDCYSCLPEKTLKFFLAATARYNAHFIVKIDDDVYLNPQRLQMAAAQWNAMNAEYIGCMKKGQVLGSSDDRDNKWYEPSGALLGEEYHLNAFGSVYAVSGLVAGQVIANNAAQLRQLANEGVLLFEIATLAATKVSIDTSATHFVRHGTAVYTQPS